MRMGLVVHPEEFVKSGQCDDVTLPSIGRFPGHEEPHRRIIVSEPWRRVCRIDVDLERQEPNVLGVEQTVVLGLHPLRRHEDREPALREEWSYQRLDVALE